MNDCPHGDDPLLCPPCQRDGGSTTLWQGGDAFTARHPGRCPACGDPIVPGEPIVREERRSRGEVETRYVCLDCA